MAIEQVHRTIVVVDIEASGRPDRDDGVRVRLNKVLHDLIADALRDAGTRDDQRSIVSTGDGLLVLIDPAVAKVRLLLSMMGCLRARLTEHNRLSASVAQFRLRVAVHAGEVSTDGVGEQVNLACRILDSPALRERLATSEGPLVMAVSDQPIYQQVVRNQRASGLDPDTFESIRVQVKETDTVAWVWPARSRTEGGTTATGNPATEPASTGLLDGRASSPPWSWLRTRRLSASWRMPRRGTPSALGDPPARGTVAVYRWWSRSREDNLTTTDPLWMGPYRAERPSDYFRDTIEGWVFAPDRPQPSGTVPLQRWWSAVRGDHLTTADPDCADAVDDGRPSDYEWERLEGYVFDPDRPQPAGTVPLYRMWSLRRGDNITVTRYQPRDPSPALQRGGYGPPVVEGFIFPV